MHRVPPQESSPRVPLTLTLSPGGRGDFGAWESGAFDQTWKLSPQPQRPFSFGFLKTKPVWNLSST